MPRKLEEVKKDIKALKENTTLSIKEKAVEYLKLDKEIDDLLNDILSKKNDVLIDTESPTPYFQLSNKVNLC